MGLLETATFGTLALSANNKPYSLPINFVYVNEAIYFHGSTKGRKIEILQQNHFAALSIVKPYALIPSYFSTTDQRACPATHFYDSLMIEGEIHFVEDFKEKAMALSALMQKLQPEGGYKPLLDAIHKKTIDATSIFKLIPTHTSTKHKFGEKLPDKRYEMILSHLQKRDHPLDRETITMMQHHRSHHAL